MSFITYGPKLNIRAYYKHVTDYGAAFNVLQLQSVEHQNLIKL